jgi:anaerobic magnesium-protoporphyrin IX monomethyl ester cyclase
MNILFIHARKDYFILDRPLRDQTEISMGISYMSSLLKEKGHKTELLIVTGNKDEIQISSFFKKFKPKLICFSSIASNYDIIKNLSRFIKHKFPGIFLMIGGPHPTLVPEEVIKDSFDALCIGEGEYPTLEVVDTLEKGKQPDKIKNLWLKKGNKIQKNPTRAFISDLDNLPFPDREMWQKWIYTKKSKQAILIGRGCPFECTYCSNHILKKISQGNYVRTRSPENIILELKELVFSFPDIKEVFFEIETIGINMQFCSDLCDSLSEFNKSEKKLSYSINLRINSSLNYDLIFSNLKKANFKMINIGLESGNQRIRKEILNRNYSNEELINVVKKAKGYGLEVSLYTMIGLPTESYEDFKDTIKVCRICQPEYIYFGFFYPYPGTRLYDYCEKNKCIMPVDREMERSRPSLKLKDFSFKQMNHEYFWFYFNVYFGKKDLFKIIRYSLPKIIYPRPFFVYATRKLLWIFSCFRKK